MKLNDTFDVYKKLRKHPERKSTTIPLFEVKNKLKEWKIFIYATVRKSLILYIERERKPAE